jgi:hypothetical protein
MLERNTIVSWGYTHVVEVNVCSTEVRKDKVSNRIRALNRITVAIECVQKPRVFGGDKFTRFLICPELMTHVRNLELNRPGRWGP